MGIDVGSRTTKIILLQDRNVIFSEISDTGVNPRKTSNELLKIIQNKFDIPSKTKIFTTGYGRKIVIDSQKAISEISCHAKGVHFLFPDVRTIIDIGGQDSKAILLNSKGKVIDFVMNDKCAAGTGRFLEVAANILELTVEDLGIESEKSNKKIEIDSTCVVFAESEIIGLISQQVKRADIIASIHYSIAHRTKSLVAQLPYQAPIVFTGGVAKNSGMRKAISKTLGIDIFVPENSSITGALGAALLALEDEK
ncbi:MAG: acyl-CoA dehydratase activase [Candidatus Cloacimonetes bacterium]|nr:acyl-CoA dehydratase activase [Candidatus Cloacimonadota bacterium]